MGVVHKKERMGHRHTRLMLMSPNARMARIAFLENMLRVSASALATMASQLSEAGERERNFIGRGHWNQIRSMGEAKNLLQYMFTAAADDRCRLWEKDMEIKEAKDELNDLLILLRQSEIQRKELLKEQKMSENTLLPLHLPHQLRIAHAVLRSIMQTT
ncbi:hypothetical protein NC651_017536 [Populus alba x Populus x berolinensis]|nr:hypothetical protein NC651_017536 [Populus alba x Populus x berolinensis]